MITRYAEPRDIDAIVSLAKDGVSEIIHARWIDENVFRTNVAWFICNPDYFCKVVVNDKDIPVAVCCFRVAQTYWNTEWVCEGVGIFVSEAHRGKGLSRLLYNQAIAWGESFDRVTHTRLQTSAGLHLNFANLFKKLGFQPVGGVFIKFKSGKKI